MFSPNPMAKKMETQTRPIHCFRSVPLCCDLYGCISISGSRVTAEKTWWEMLTKIGRRNLHG